MMSNPSQVFISSLMMGFAFIHGAISAIASPKITPPSVIHSLQIYSQAKKELPEKLYVAYRIIERIARANTVAQMPWYVVMTTEQQDGNTVATKPNLITIQAELLEQVEGDPAAIACFIGHEMAHHTLRHSLIGEAEFKASQQKIRQEAEQEVLEKLKADRGNTGLSISSTVLQRVGQKVPGIAGNILGLLGSLTGVVAQERSENSTSLKIEQIVKQKQIDLETTLTQTIHRQEFEADSLGYIYMARAGFEPDGCLRMVDVTARTAKIVPGIVYPSSKIRIRELERQITEKPAMTLTKDGALALRSSVPLTYSFSSENKIVRINSLGGNSTVDRMEEILNQ